MAQSRLLRATAKISCCCVVKAIPFNGSNSSAHIAVTIPCLTLVADLQLTVRQASSRTGRSNLQLATQCKGRLPSLTLQSIVYACMGHSLKRCLFS